MTPTPRGAAMLAALALAAFFVPLPLAALAALALLAAAAVDARAARRAPAVERALPAVLARGVPVPLRATAEAPPSVRVRLRQAVPPGMALEPAEADGALDAQAASRGCAAATSCPPSARARPGRSGSPPGTTRPAGRRRSPSTPTCSPPAGSR